MPELPEVETIVRDLNKIVPGKTIKQVLVRDSFVLRQDPQNFISCLENQTITQITRRGKAIIMQLASGEFWVTQLMMTGQLVIGQLPHAHTRLEFVFADRTNLLYNDQRRFGQLRVVSALDEIKHFRILGVEPLSSDFNVQYMARVFKNIKRPIKNVLLDHTLIAGIGNIYACEILFESNINPQLQASGIKVEALKRLYTAVKDVLTKAIEYRGSSMRNYRDAAGAKGNFNQKLCVYSRTGQPCYVCGQPIKRFVQGGRSTFYCSECQK